MVARLLNRGSRIFESQQNTILSAAGVIAAIYTLSAFLGFIRNRILSSYFGDSAELGIFFAADDIPSLMFSLIISGSLSVSFIPVFTKYYKKNQKGAWEFTSSIINISLLLLIIAIFIIFGGSQFIVENTIARNSTLNEAELLLLSDLMRIMMLAQIGFIFSSFYTSILHSFKRFVIPAMAPVMLNAGMIIFMVLFVDKFGIYAPAYGTLFGAALHMIIQIPYVMKLGFRHKFTFDYKNKAVIQVYKLMIPRTISQAAQRLLIPLYTNLALYISAPSNVILTFADDLQTLPVRIFGMSIGQAALPLLAHAYEDKDISKFKKLLLNTIYQITFFVLPVAVIMFILRVPLVRLAVGASKYSWEATVMTGYTLGFFSISLVFQSLILVLTRGFYALSDTKTPLKISLIVVFVNGVLAILFVKGIELGVWSLALAFAISSVIYSILLFVFMARKIGGVKFSNFIKPINRMGIATLVMGISLYVPLKIMEVLIFDTTRTLNLLLLTFIVTLIAAITYVYLTYKMGVREVNIIFKAYLKIKKVIQS